MATLPTPSESGRILLDLIVDTLHIRPAQFVSVQPVKTVWMKRGLRVEDLSGAFDYAREQGWLSYDEYHEVFFLTELGFSTSGSAPEANALSDSNSIPCAKIEISIPTADSAVNNNSEVHIVILVHGIRDHALWQSTLRATLQKEGFQAELTNYGRMNLFQFLIPIKIFRAKAISDLWEQIRTVRQNHPAARVSVIAHSFGTFAVAQLMKEQFDLKFFRVIFCGSVVKYKFRFNHIQDRFKAPILNEVGTRDPWPALAKSMTTGYGSAGTYGFRRPLVRDRWHNGAGHNFFLSPTFCKKFWVPFLRTGEIVDGDLDPEPPRLWLRLVSLLPIKLLLLVLIGWYAMFSSYSPLPDDWKSRIKNGMAARPRSEVSQPNANRLPTQRDEASQASPQLSAPRPETAAANSSGTAQKAQPLP
jgi:hypothetical protein